MIWMKFFWSFSGSETKVMTKNDSHPQDVESSSSYFFSSLSNKKKGEACLDDSLIQGTVTLKREETSVKPATEMHVCLGLKKRAK